MDVAGILKIIAIVVQVLKQVWEGPLGEMVREYLKRQQKEKNNNTQENNNSQ